MNTGSDWNPTFRAERFPVELPVPETFCVDDPASWPAIPGRLEFIEGRLLFMPPCGGVQQVVAVSVAVLLDHWVEQRIAEGHDDFVVGGNEAGMLLAGEVRAADAALWRRGDIAPGEIPAGYFQVPPVLAVEIAGNHEDEAALTDKAAWYLQCGVQTVWVVLPDAREVLFIKRNQRFRCHDRQTMPDDVALPGLQLDVARFFRRL